MKPFAARRILAATDFSDLSTWALRHAVMWAQHYGSHLTVLHVQQFPWMTGDPYFDGYNVAELIETLEEAATQQLAEQVQTYVPPDLPVSSKVVPGSPASAIEEYAAGEGADLVVLGTHGRGGLSRLFLGSVAERTLRMAQHPTLIVRQVHTEEASKADAPRVSHILCPVNYTEVARAAFEHACAVAQTFAARLTVVFAVEQEDATPESLRRAEERLQSWLPAEAATACEIQPMVRHGDAAEQVITLASQAAVDLVVIGAQHRRFVDTTVLGITTERVTRHAPCPVLVVPRSSDP
jgi:nucleotide-binding universal stress UspA family protein